MDLLCIPCCLNAGNDDYYRIFFVDLSNKDEILEECVPTLRVSRKFDLACFWVKNSTLYMISRSSKRVGTLELSEELLRSPEPIVLEECMIKYVAPMKHQKRWPMIVPTLDGKMLVMSKSIKSQQERRDVVPLVDFEIYDSDKDCWETLPSIQSYWPDNVRQTCLVEWAAFSDSNTLLVKTRDMSGFISARHNLSEIRAMSGYLFELDVSKGSWKVREKVYCGLEYPFSGLTTIVNGELCFNPFEVYDIQHMSGTASVCGKAILPDDLENYQFRFRSCLVSSIGGDGDDGVCYFYVVETASEKEKENAKLRVAVYRVDIGKYNMDKKELESVCRNEIMEKEKEYNKKVRKLTKKYGGKGMRFINSKAELSVAYLNDRIKWGRKPQIDMLLTSSFQIPCKIKDRFFPMELSLCGVPASYPGDGKRKRKRKRMQISYLGDGKRPRIRGKRKRMQISAGQN